MLSAACRFLVAILSRSLPYERRASSLVALTLLSTPGVVHADEDARARARRHFARGVELANEGAYGEAIVEFGRAYELSPHHSVLYNVGQAYVALGRPVEAVDTLTRYLAEGGDKISAERRKEVAEEIQRQQSRIATLEITCDVPNAAVFLDGQPEGRTPLPAPVRVGIGRHQILVQTDDGRRSQQIIQIAGEERRTIAFELERPPEASPPPVPSRTGFLHVSCPTSGVEVIIDGSAAGVTPLARPLALPAGSHMARFVHPSGTTHQRVVVIPEGGVARAECDVSALRRGAPREAAPSSAQATFGYLLGGLGLALGGGALGHYLWNKGRYDDWRARHRELQRRPEPAAQRENNDLARSIDRASVVTVGLTVGAGLALGAGTALVLTDGNPAGDVAFGAPPRTVTVTGVW